jgi:hypothetical protein
MVPIAVMQQVYADSNNQQLPSSSLIKAVLYNSAEDIYNKGIDYKTVMACLIVMVPSSHTAKEI